jgi:alkanesulfonate monooxygenase SsuD/methylene tetrahydromethanopterin reductase-like flavin-dependent oxidoreductase (luciferase family)
MSKKGSRIMPNTKTVSFGLGLLAGPPKGQIAKWADDLDVSLPRLAGHFDGLWMTDHFFWEDSPTYEAWTAMTYAAARWPAFKVGSIVLGQSYRNPALTAKMGATLQALSRGRFVLGIGAGWKEDEYHAYGYPYPSPGTRIEQLEDALIIIKRLWSEPGKVTYHGKHYHVVDAYCEPRPEPMPPIMVGGGGQKTARLAAQYADWWNLPDANFTYYSERLKVLKAQCEAVGRDFTSIGLSWFGRLIVGKTESAALALGKGKWTSQNAFVGTPQQVIEQMQPFVEAGVTYFVCEVQGLPDPDVIGMVLEEVLPKVKKG